jgi:hypothetical protein
MKSTLSFLLLVTTVLPLFYLTSCGKDELIKDDVYIVEFIPSQCGDTHSNVLGLKTQNAEYYLIVEDSTNLFETMVQGDRVKVGFTFESNVIVCFACNCPSPDNGVIINSISKVN